MVALAQEHKRALVVPRTQPRMEQHIRASLWQKLGAVTMADPAGLTAGKLADRVASMFAESDAPTQHDLDLGGLDRITKRFESLSQKEQVRANSVCVQ
jgi:predicted glycosyltransferase